MARKFLTPIDLAQNELQNGRVQNLGTAPTSPAPVKGQIYFNSTDNTLYWYDGTVWVAAKSAAAAYGPVVSEATFGGTSTDGVLTTVSRSDHKHANPVHDNAAHSAVTLNSLAAPTGNVSMGGFKITNLGEPTTGTDAATKNYTDNLVAGLAWMEPARVATTANITLSGLQTIDGVTVVTNDRVLVKNQTAPAQNGVYLAQSGSWTRSLDADSEGDLLNMALFISEGTTQADTAWVLTADAPITVGTTGLPYVQFAGGGAVTAGAGLTQTGNVLDVVATNASIVVAADSIGVGFGGTGAAVTAARSDHAHANTLQKYVASVGGATSSVVTHNFGTKDVVVNVYRVATPFDEVECDVEMTDTNNITLRFSVAPAALEYRCVIIG